MGEGGGVLRRWNKRYAAEYGVSAALYLVLVLVCVPRALGARTMSIRALLLIGPCFGIVAMAAVVIRHVMRIDEFLRHSVIEYFAVAAGFTGAWTLAYGFFELAGFPRISVWWIWPGMALSMLLWSAMKRLRQS